MGLFVNKAYFFRLKKEIDHPLPKIQKQTLSNFPVGFNWENIIRQNNDTKPHLVENNRNF